MGMSTPKWILKNRKKMLSNKAKTEEKKNEINPNQVLNHLPPSTSPPPTLRNGYAAVTY